MFSFICNDFSCRLSFFSTLSPILCYYFILFSSFRVSFAIITKKKTQDDDDKKNCISNEESPVRWKDRRFNTIQRTTIMLSMLMKHLYIIHPLHGQMHTLLCKNTLIALYICIKFRNKKLSKYTRKKTYKREREKSENGISYFFFFCDGLECPAHKTANKFGVR